MRGRAPTHTFVCPYCGVEPKPIRCVVPHPRDSTRNWREGYTPQSTHKPPCGAAANVLRAKGPQQTVRRSRASQTSEVLHVVHAATRVAGNPASNAL